VRVATAYLDLMLVVGLDVAVDHDYVLTTSTRPAPMKAATACFRVDPLVVEM